MRPVGKHEDSNIQNQQQARTSESSRRAEAKLTGLQKRALIVLGIGAVIALVLALGVVAFVADGAAMWVVRAGVLVAILAGAWALVTSFRELYFEKLETERRLIKQSREHGRVLSAERQRNGEVVESLRRSNVDASQRLRKAQTQVHDGQVRIVELTGTVGRLNAELSTLRGNNLALKQNLQERDARIRELTERLEAAEAELAALTAETEGDDQVVALPRHARPKSASDSDAVWDKLPTAEELWSDGNVPTVVDLQRLAFPTPEVEERKQA